MSPYQHGEVYVLDDGSETDLDLGHYERFTNSPLSRDCNYTTGQIYHPVYSPATRRPLRVPQVFAMVRHGRGRDRVLSQVEARIDQTFLGTPSAMIAGTRR